jgi:hypothetical protein
MRQAAAARVVVVGGGSVGRGLQEIPMAHLARSAVGPLDITVVGFPVAAPDERVAAAFAEAVGVRSWSVSSTGWWWRRRPTAMEAIARPVTIGTPRPGSALSPPAAGQTSSPSGRHR